MFSYELKTSNAPKMPVGTSETLEMFCLEHIPSCLLINLYHWSGINLPRPNGVVYDGPDNCGPYHEGAHVHGLRRGIDMSRPEAEEQHDEQKRASERVYDDSKRLRNLKRPPR